MPSTTSSSVSRPLASSTVMTPSLPTLLHRFSNHAADFAFAVGRNGADLSDFFRTLDLLGLLADFGNDMRRCQVDTALQVHRVHAGGNRLQAFADDRLGKNRCRRRAVAGNVIGLGGDFAHHLCAHVFELVFEFDFLRDGDAVFGGARCTEGFFDDDVTAFRAKRHFDGVGEDIDAAQHAVAGVG